MKALINFWISGSIGRGSDDIGHQSHIREVCLNRVFQNLKNFELNCGLLLTYDA